MTTATPRKTAVGRKTAPRKTAEQRPLTPQELAKLEAETREVELRSRKLELELEASNIFLDRERLSDQIRTSGDDYAHVYRFVEHVEERSTQKCIRTLALWDRLDPKAAWTIVINSPGGYVIEGMALFDFLLEMRAKGHHITTLAQGMAASMGGILLQAGDVRKVGRESYILVHEISTGAIGKLSEIEDEIEFSKKMTDRILAIFESRTNMTATQIKRAWTRKDWWLDSEEALAKGFVDEIV